MGSFVFFPTSAILPRGICSGERLIMGEGASKTIILTRPEGSNRRLSRRCEEHGLAIREIPLLHVEALSIPEEVRIEIERLESFEWLVFSSQNGVKAFAKHLESVTGEASLPSSVRIAAQGVATAELVEKSFNRSVDIIPELKTAQGLAIALAAQGLVGRKLLLPLAVKTSGELLRVLEAADGEIVSYSAYQTSPCIPEENHLEFLKSVAPEELIFLFMSPSACSSALQGIPNGLELLQKTCNVSVGPVTSKALHDSGLKVYSEAKSPDMEDLLSALKLALNS